MLYYSISYICRLCSRPAEPASAKHSGTRFFHASLRGAKLSYHTGVCAKNTPPDEKTCGNISLQNTKSGAGEQFLLLCCGAKARSKGVLFHRHLHHVISHHTISRRLAPRKEAWKKRVPECFALAGSAGREHNLQIYDIL